MVTIEQLAQAALAGDSLSLRSLTQDFLRGKPSLRECPPPRTEDARLLAATASLIELFAMRLQQTPPPWAKDVAPLSEPIFLLKAAATMKRLRIYVRLSLLSRFASAASTRRQTSSSSPEPTTN